MAESGSSSFFLLFVEEEKRPAAQRTQDPSAPLASPTEKWNSSRQAVEGAAAEGKGVGVIDGSGVVGLIEGRGSVGSAVGVVGGLIMDGLGVVGRDEGCGVAVGEVVVGSVVGNLVTVGAFVSCWLGTEVGGRDGVVVGRADGPTVGGNDGADEGFGVGL